MVVTAATPSPAFADLTAPPRHVRAYSTRLAPVSPAHPALLQAIARGIQITGKGGATILLGDVDDPTLGPVLSAPSAVRLALAQILDQLDPADLQVLPATSPRIAARDPAQLPWYPEPPRLVQLPRDANRLFVLASPHLPASLDLRRYGPLIRDFAAADRAVLFVADGPAHACALRLWLAVHGLRVATILSEPPLGSDTELLALRACVAPLSEQDLQYVEAVLEAMHETDGFPPELALAGLPLAEGSDVVRLHGGLVLSLADRRVRGPGREPVSPAMPPDLFFARPGQTSPVAARWFWLHSVDQWLDDHLLEEAVDGR